MNLKIDNIMTTKILTIKNTEGMESAYLKMKLNGIRHLPVIDSLNQVVGIISDRDVQRSMLCFEADQIEFSPDDLVANFMTRDIKSVGHESELIHVVQMMIDNQISAVLITENNNLVGIITHEDLLLILADLLRPKSGIVANVQNWVYKTPIGQIAERFSSIGI